MSFVPVVPSGGVTGWAFLQRTRESQQSSLDNSSLQTRDTDYFRQNIANATTAEELVADRRLLRVALGAFGLDADIGNKYFVKKVLEDGTTETSALANKLSDKRYLAFSKAFGFGDFPVANTQTSTFPEKIISAFQDQQFEVAVGDQNEDLRLALGVDREMDNLLAKSTSDDGLWFTVMGTPTLRRVFEGALGLPSSLAGLDIDRQLDEFRDKAKRVFGEGEVSQFSGPEMREKLIRRFLVLSEVSGNSATVSSGNVALTLLRNSAIPRAN